MPLICPTPTKITYSVLTQPTGLAVLAPNNLPFAGESGIFIGDSSIASGGGLNGYELRFENTPGAGKITLWENGVDTQSSTGLLDSSYAGLDFVEIQIVVSNVGAANQSAIAQWRNVDDATGAGTSAFTRMGNFDALEGAVFTLNNIAILTTRQDLGGASLIGFDNVRVTPEPACLMLLGLGGLMVLRRRRLA